jgi:post-segregation antitoxin (ccd killing protein)
VNELKMATQQVDKRIVVTASIRSSLVERLAQEARARQTNVSRIVDEAVEFYFSKRGKRGRQSGRVATVTRDSQIQEE